MRRAALLVALIVMASIATAQRPWGEYDQRQRERIVEHRTTPDVVRRAVRDYEALDAEERVALWAEISQPIRDRRRASLYLYLYDLLRPIDGSAHDVDIAILKGYTRYMLERLSDVLHDRDVYNYAYTLARHDVVCGRRSGVDGVLRMMNRRRYKHRYSELVATLEGGIAIARASLALDREMWCDHTAGEVTCCVPREVTQKEYALACSSVEPIAGESGDELHRSMVAECITCGGQYHSVVYNHQGVRVVLSEGSTRSVAMVEDASGMWHTLPALLYMLPSGGLFAIMEDDEGRVEGVVVGANVDDRLHSVVVAMHGGLLRGVKCTAEVLYLWLEDERGDMFYSLSVAEYGCR